ncbi:MAG: TMEM175 family protein [Actinomycetota bacterium]
MSRGRLEAFSDGVFAIAITLLIIEIRPPHSEPGRLAHDLADLWPAYASYAVSFAIIGIIWVNHHQMFDRIATVDRTLLFLNLGLLFTVAFLPFPTAVLADYIRDGDNSHIAAALYSADMTAIGLAFIVTWWYVIRTPQLLADGIRPEALRRGFRKTLVGPVV